MTLTLRQTDVLDYIKDYVQENGYPPTTREIGLTLKFASTSTVHRHLLALREKGYLDWVDGAPRTLKVLQ